MWSTLKMSKVATYCDFGEPERKDELSRHKNWDTAKRQFKRISRIYTGIHGWRCWQEEVEDAKINN